MRRGAGVGVDSCDLGGIELPEIGLADQPTGTAGMKSGVAKQGMDMLDRILAHILAREIRANQFQVDLHKKPPVGHAYHGT